MELAGGGIRFNNESESVSAKRFKGHSGQQSKQEMGEQMLVDGTDFIIKRIMKKRFTEGQ